MEAHRKNVEGTIQNDTMGHELSKFWLRKTKKPVLCVLLVEKADGKARFFRGVNVEVSMPTGSLCAERNCIGTAVAMDPSLRREDIKMLAVLSMPMIGSGAEVGDTRASMISTTLGRETNSAALRSSGIPGEENFPGSGTAREVTFSGHQRDHGVVSRSRSPPVVGGDHSEEVNRTVTAHFGINNPEHHAPTQRQLTTEGVEGTAGTVGDAGRDSEVPILRDISWQVQPRPANDMPEERQRSRSKDRTIPEAIVTDGLDRNHEAFWSGSESSRRSPTMRPRAMLEVDETGHTATSPKMLHYEQRYKDSHSSMVLVVDKPSPKSGGASSPVPSLSSSSPPATPMKNEDSFTRALGGSSAKVLNAIRSARKQSERETREAEQVLLVSSADEEVIESTMMGRETKNSVQTLAFGGTGAAPARGGGGSAADSDEESLGKGVDEDGGVSAPGRAVLSLEEVSSGVEDSSRVVHGVVEAAKKPVLNDAAEDLDKNTPPSSAALEIVPKKRANAKRKPVVLDLGDEDGILIVKDDVAHGNKVGPISAEADEDLEFGEVPQAALSVVPATNGSLKSTLSPPKEKDDVADPPPSAGTAEALAAGVPSVPAPNSRDGHAPLLPATKLPPYSNTSSQKDHLRPAPTVLLRADPFVSPLDPLLSTIPVLFTEQHADFHHEWRNRTIVSPEPPVPLSDYYSDQPYVVRINMLSTAWERNSLTRCLCLGVGGLGFVNDMRRARVLGIELLIQTGGVVVPRNSSGGAYVASACHIVDLSTSYGDEGRQRPMGEDCNELRSYGQVLLQVILTT